MKKRNELILILFSTVVVFFATTFKTLTAQDKLSSSKINKYEIAIDLQQFFAYGYPNKVLFKVNNIKDRQIKGAYRFGIGASYWIDKHKSTEDNKNYREVKRLENTNLSLSFGYEFQKSVNRAVFFYGADLGAIHSIADDSELPNYSTRYELFFVPFVGAKVPISDNLSLAFEAGLTNRVNILKSESSLSTPDSRASDIIYQSKIELPYSLTFNFNF